MEEFFKSSVSKILEKITPKQAFLWVMVLTIFGCTMYVLTPLSNLARELIQVDDLKEMLKVCKDDIVKSQAQIDLLANEKIREKKAYDSIKRQQDALEAKRLSKNRRTIMKRFVETKYSVPNISSVNYWSMHNVESRWYLEVFISTEDIIETQWKEPEPIPKGFEWLAQTTADNPFTIINDVKLNSNLYIGDSKLILNKAGTKALLCALVRDTGTDYFIVSISFTKENIIDYYPEYRHLILYLSEFVQEKTSK